MSVLSALPSHQLLDMLRVEEPSPDLIEACGERPRPLCEWTFDATGGNDTAAGVVDWAIGRPLAILLIIFGAAILARFARRYFTKVIVKLVSGDGKATQRKLNQLGIEKTTFLFGSSEEESAQMAARRIGRGESVAGVVSNTTTVVIWSIAFILVLGELGINLGPFIAGAGIVGVALGFGAQSLVKDCISGIFILMEDQYGIGDIVDLGEASGTVEEIALRTTVLRGVDGTVWHVPNGEIQRVGNKSQLWSTALVDIDVAYDSDIDGVRRILEESARAVCASEEWSADVLEEPQVLGVEMLAADGVTLRVVVKTAPGAQWALQRRLREGFKRSLDEAGIEIPFPQRTVWMRNAES